MSLITTIKKANGHDLLYHTTSLHNALKILETNIIKPKDARSYISFSEKPFVSDISGNDVALGFDPKTLKLEVVKVYYTERWFNQHPEQASYVAGDGWREQFSLDDFVTEDDIDPDTGEVDPDVEEMAYHLAELQAFKDKYREIEWITQKTKPIILTTNAIVTILTKTGKTQILNKIQELHLQHITVRSSSY